MPRIQRIVDGLFGPHHISIENAGTIPRPEDLDTLFECDSVAAVDLAVDLLQERLPMGTEPTPWGIREEPFPDREDQLFHLRLRLHRDGEATLKTETDSSLGHIGPWGPIMHLLFDQQEAQRLAAELTQRRLAALENMTRTELQEWPDRHNHIMTAHQRGFDRILRGLDILPLQCRLRTIKGDQDEDEYREVRRAAPGEVGVLSVEYDFNRRPSSVNLVFENGCWVCPGWWEILDPAEYEIVEESGL